MYCNTLLGNIFMLLSRKLIVYFASIAVISSSAALDTLRVGMSLGTTFQETKPKNLQGLNLQSFVRKSPYIGIFVGYDHLIQDTPLFVGLEGELANHSSEKVNEFDNTTGGSFKLSDNNSFIGAIRAGVSVGEALFYGKIGLSRTNWKTTVSTPVDALQRGHQSYGNVVGGGMECKINNNCSLGIEHTLTDVHDIKRVHPNLSMSLSPSIQVTKLRLAYNF